MREIVVSVMHSGTHFLKAHFDVRESFHAHWSWEQLVQEAAAADVIYVPLRHPREIMESWIRRERLSCTQGRERWYTSWTQLHALDAMFDLDVVAVDLHKDPRIKNWSPVMSKRPLAPRKWSKVEWEPILQLPIVKRHYGS